MTNDHVNLLNVLLNFNINFNLVNWPTRVTDTSVTTLDNVFVNFSNSGLSCVLDNTVSDHRTVLVELDFETELSYFIQKRQFGEDSINHFIVNLINENWNSVYGILDTNLAFQAFINIFLYHFNNSFPSTRKKNQNN
uniref:Uncharacterized protein LOC114347850 n=1 Tax=Diabrotica virgifera virgifera TaxID=50390 RepID=A0A6P7GX50_DIAVI